MKKNNVKNESGATLIEILIAVVLTSIVAITALLILNGKMKSVHNSAVSKEVQIAGENALSQLSAVSKDLNEGGSFTLAKDNKITLSGSCSEKTCDYILEPDASRSQKTSVAGGFPFGTTLPTGSEVKFIRRWRVDNKDATYNLRTITVVVVEDLQQTSPRLILQTDSPTNR